MVRQTTERRIGLTKTVGCFPSVLAFASAANVTMEAAAAAAAAAAILTVLPSISPDVGGGRGLNGRRGWRGAVSLFEAGYGQFVGGSVLANRERATLLD